MLDIPIETTGDILNMALAGGFIVLVLFLVMVLVRVFRILGNVTEITENVMEITEVVQHYIWQPVKLVATVVKKLKSFLKK